MSPKPGNITTIVATNERVSHTALGDSEQHFRLLVESVKDYAILMLDPQGRVASWNAGAKRIKGYNSEEIIGQSFERFYTEPDRARHWPQTLLKQAVAQGSVEDTGWRVRKDGIRFWANVNITAIRDDDGHLMGYAKVTRDLTEQRNTAKAMRASEERFSLLVQSVKDYAILMLDPQGKVASWNVGAKRIKGYDSEEIIGQSFERFYTEEDRARQWPHSLLAQAVAQGSVEDTGWRVRKDGMRFWANVDITAIRDDEGQLMGYAKVTRDLTEQRSAAEAIRANEERFRTIVEAAPNGFLMVNTQGEIVLLNSQVEQIFGYTREELIGRSFDTLVSPEHRERHPENRETYTQRPSARAVNMDRELYGIRKDGRLVPVEIENTPISTQDGAFVLASVIDATERKQTEASLRQSEAHLNEAQRLAHLGGWELSLEDSAMIWSNEIFNILEVDRETTTPDYAIFVGKIHPEDRDTLMVAFQTSIQDHAPYEVVHRLVMADGRIKYVRERGETYYEDDTPIRTLGTIQDITALKEAEDALNKLNRELEQRVAQRTAELSVTNQHLQQSLEHLNKAQTQLVQSEKMAALGGLVAGIAHEINTPAGVGLTAASHLQTQVDKYHLRYTDGTLTRSDFENLLTVARESCDIVVHNLQRAADLIRSFKQVAVDQSSDEQRLFNLKKYLEEILLSLRPRLRCTGHRVVINCPADLQLYSHPGAFSQIITNFIINSLLHGFEDRPVGEIIIDIEQASDKLILRYSDNGKGIDKEALGKIFDPFFTTKRGQGGSGLGMHIVHNLVTQLLNGQIHCDSTPGTGISFTITLPPLILRQDSIDGVLGRDEDGNDTGKAVEQPS